MKACSVVTSIILSVLSCIETEILKSIKMKKTLIAQSASEMVRESIISFQALRYPRCYEDFTKALHYAIARMPDLAKEQQEAARILSYLVV